MSQDHYPVRWTTLSASDVSLLLQRLNNIQFSGITKPTATHILHVYSHFVNLFQPK